MIIKGFKLIFVACVAVLTAVTANAQITIRTLDQAIERAVTIDPWQHSNGLTQKALTAQSESVNTLPDPKLSFGLLNMPTDGFALDQEPMTQARVGISQAFNRGQSAELKRQQLLALASQYPYLSDDRQANVAAKVAQLWLEGYGAQLSLSVLEEDRGLFEQLASTVEAQYSSAQGNTRQDDVIRAKLEVSKLNDRLLILRDQRDASMANLSLWLMDDTNLQDVDIVFPNAPLEIPFPQVLTQSAHLDTRLISGFLMTHPAIQALQQKITASKTSIEIAQQAYRPKWALDASYSYRQDNQIGQSRADFFSIGVSLEMPIFGTQQQDGQIQSAKHQSAAIETQKRLMIRQMISQLNVLISKHSRLIERFNGYQTDILPQLRQQAEASLTAYTSDDKPFSEVMQAKIAELNGRLAMINITIEIYKVRKHLLYYLDHVSMEPGNENINLLEGQ